MGLRFRRRRPVARMAAGAATAGIAYHAGKRRSEQDAYNEQAAAAYQQAQAAPQPQYAPPPPAPPAAAGSSTDDLEKLVQLHSQGALTDEEFAAAKSKLLGL